MKKDLINSTSINNLNYRGTVAVKLLDGDRIIYNSKSHNNGKEPLFKFLSSCLAGDFTGAKDIRPCKIVLFKQDIGEITGTFDRNYWTEQQRVSNPVYYDSAAVQRFDEEGKCAVTYHFRVPYLSLIAGETINKVGLYPNLISSDQFATGLCAYNFLDAPITIPNGGGNFTVIIDWTITITNN